MTRRYAVRKPSSPPKWTEWPWESAKASIFPASRPSSRKLCVIDAAVSPKSKAMWGRVAPARHLDVVGQAVFGPEVGDLARPRHAPAARDVLVGAQEVDGVVDDGGDRDAVDGGERHQPSVRAREAED